MASILIIDDDPTIRAMFSRALAPLGETEQAGNGADGLRSLTARKFDVILLDLHMPVVDGFVLLDALANKPGPNRDTPVYVISADTSDNARVRALRRHAVFFLSKPVPIMTLVSLVDSTLKKAAARALIPLRPAAGAARMTPSKPFILAVTPPPDTPRPISSAAPPPFSPRLTPFPRSLPPAPLSGTPGSEPRRPPGPDTPRTPPPKKFGG